jgi:hypothetical protein
MDSTLVYAKTPAGNEAVRRSTGVVQRDLRMVLLQIDGALSVGQLVTKIGDQRLVEAALRVLEAGSFIEVTAALAKPEVETAAASTTASGSGFPAIMRFSSVDPSSMANTVISDFSTFDQPMPFSAREPVVEKHSPPPVVKEAPPLRPIRRIAWGRWLLGGIVGALLLLLAALLFYPYDDFRPSLEAELSRQLAAPVRVGGVRLGLLPRPRLLLSDVTVGAEGEGRIASLAIGSPHLLLGAPGEALPEVEASGVRLTANRLVDLPMFGRSTAGNKFPIQRLRVSGATVVFGDLASPEWHGEIRFRADGGMDTADVRSADDSLRLAVTPAAQGMALVIEASRWNPEGMPFGFDAFQANGLLEKNHLLLREVDTNCLGGRLKGSGSLDWSAGMTMVGEASLARLDASRVMTALAPSQRLIEGELNGVLRLGAMGSGWQDLLGRIEADLDAQVARGVLTGLDLGELARRGPGAVVQGGSTRFETLRARLGMTRSRVVARSLELDAGLMKASGRATVEASGQVDGSVNVQARFSVSSVRVPARLSGVLPNNLILTANNPPAGEGSGARAGGAESKAVAPIPDQEE